MPLQPGLWRVNVNGTEGELNINQVGAQGRVNGMIFGQSLAGLWDEGAQTLTFSVFRLVMVDEGSGTGVTQLPVYTPQSYTGYLFSTLVKVDVADELQ